MKLVVLVLFHHQHVLSLDMLKMIVDTFQASREETARMARKLEWLKTDLYLQEHVKPRLRGKSEKNYSCYSFEENEADDTAEIEDRDSSPSPPPRRRRR